MDTTKALKDKISCRNYSQFSLFLEANFAKSFFANCIFRNIAESGTGTLSLTSFPSILNPHPAPSYRDCSKHVMSNKGSIGVKLPQENIAVMWIQFKHVRRVTLAKHVLKGVREHLHASLNHSFPSGPRHSYLPIDLCVFHFLLSKLEEFSHLGVKRRAQTR